MTTCFEIRDINGALVHEGVPVTADFNSIRRQANTNAQGIAKFAEDVPLTANVYTIGYATVKRVICEQTGTPQPLPEGEQVVQTIGTQCDIVQKYMFNIAWYKHKNRYTGEGSSWDSDQNDAVYRANQDASCFAPPPPPPTTVVDVEKSVDILRATITSVKAALDGFVVGFGEAIDSLTNSVNSLKTDVADLVNFMNQIEDWFVNRFVAMKDIVIGWIIEQFVSIVEKVLEGEKKT